MSPVAKAFLATFVFSSAGAVSFAFAAPVSPLLTPHAAFYVVLVLNSFFSVRLYSRIQPKDALQTFFDALLVVVYLALALSIGQVVLFPFLALLVFVVAAPKYAFMLGKIPHESLLRRKILIDLAGAALCLAVLAGTLSGYELEGAWTLAIVFAIANIYLLLVRPMYVLPERL